MKTQYRQDLEDIFAYMCQYHRENTYPPTLREMADTFFMSPSSIMRHLDKMEAAGWIAREWGKARGITLLRTCAAEPNYHRSK
ncbi:MAG: transcriptional regulator [Chloroflexota bacterium]